MTTTAPVRYMVVEKETVNTGTVSVLQKVKHDVKDAKIYEFAPYTLRPQMQRWLLQFTKHVFVIEGNIGSGKTTLGHNLILFLRMHDIDAVFMPERVPEEILQKYITYSHDHPENKNPYAFELQKQILLSRIEIYKAAQQFANEGKVVFIDRSLPGDYAFALNNFSEGNISAAEWAQYNDILRKHASEILQPSGVIYLDTTVEVCVCVWVHTRSLSFFLTLFIKCILKRIAKRNREAEHLYSTEYLASIARCYQIMFARINYPVLKIPYSGELEVDRLDVCEMISKTVLMGLETLLHQDRDGLTITLSI